MQEASPLTSQRAPDLPTDGAWAVWWEQNGEYALAYARQVYAIRGRLVDAVAAAGPTGIGRLRAKVRGWKYKPDAASEYPKLVRAGVVSVTVPTPVEAERAYELLLTEFPGQVVDMDLKVDGRAANTAILSGGETGKRLSDLREPTGYDLEIVE